MEFIAKVNAEGKAFVKFENELIDPPIGSHDFIPIVSLDKGQLTSSKKRKYEYKDFEIVENYKGKLTKLSKHLDNNKQPLHAIKIYKETIVRFIVKKGNSKANDNDGKIAIRSNGVTVLTKNIEDIEYGHAISLRIDAKNITNDAYINFYASDNDGGLTEIHCGRVAVKKLNYNSLNDHIKGFLDVLNESGTRISIARFAKIDYLGYNEDNTREKFKILDWPNENKLASVSANNNGKSRFTNTIYEEEAEITFEIDNNRLKLGSSSNWIHAATDPSNPIPKGTHNIWLPDYYHGYGEGYLSITEFACVWFRLGSESSSRYLHVGSVSAGCVTVGERDTGGTDTDKAKWNDIYNYLIKRRKNTKLIGIIKII